MHRNTRPFLFFVHALTPDYEAGCKRIVVSGGFHEAVQQPIVSIVTEGIEPIETNGIRLRDGSFQPLDTIILGTGFDADGFLRPMPVIGKESVDLDEFWANVFMNYKSVALPNLFYINGPFDSLLLTGSCHLRRAAMGRKQPFAYGCYAGQLHTPPRSLPRPIDSLTATP